MFVLIYYKIKNESTIKNLKSKPLNELMTGPLFYTIGINLTVFIFIYAILYMEKTFLPNMDNDRTFINKVINFYVGFFLIFVELRVLKQLVK